MDTQAQVQVNENKFPQPTAINNNKIIIVVIILLIMVLSFLVILLFVLKSNKTSFLPSATQTESNTNISPTITGIVVPVVTSYDNPFEQKTQYTNPFSDNTNPFDNLK